MSSEEKIQVDVKMWTMIGLFLISSVSSIGSYYKALSDIKEEIYKSNNQLSREIREEMRSNYATKEEARYIQISVNEIKDSIKNIDKKMVR